MKKPLGSPSAFYAECPVCAAAPLWPCLDSAGCEIVAHAERYRSPHRMDRRAQIGAPLSRQIRDCQIPTLFAWNESQCEWPRCGKHRDLGTLCLRHHRELLACANYDVARSGLRLAAISTTKDGYLRTVGPDGKSQGIHRLVMQARIGRGLLPDENVHHRNGNRADNRPRNLELWVTAQPAGKRPQDLVKFAKEILARYDNPKAAS